MIGRILRLFFILALLSTTGNCQLCQDVAQYGQCSLNSACGCFHMLNAVNTGVCGFLWTTCTQLTPCDSSDHTCHQPETVCVRHPRCRDVPLCYPVSMIDTRICPPMTMSNNTVTSTTTTLTTTVTEPPPLSVNSKWIQHGMTVAGGNDRGHLLNQLAHPNAIYVNDDEQTIYIGDNANNRIVEWKANALNGQVLIGGNETDSRTDPLDSLLDMAYDKTTDSFLICDFRNRQVLRWARHNSRKSYPVISNISCFTLAVDDNGDIYVYNDMKYEVRRWREGQTNSTLVAGGNGLGTRLDQLECPSSMFVDRDLTVYISDGCNHRVVKWMKDAKQGIVVAGGQGQGSSARQLAYPKGVVVDHLNNVYVVDSKNHRVMRWLPRATEGTVIVGGNGGGEASDQLYYPSRLAFDRQHNLYVVDQANERVQKFALDLN